MNLKSPEVATPAPAERVIAGVTVPDTPLVRDTVEWARASLSPFLFNHVMRSWLFATLLARLENAHVDTEVLAVTVLGHDMGLMSEFVGPHRFEVDGANAGRSFAQRQGMSARQCQLVWDGIALHSTPSIAHHKEDEVRLAQLGIGLDFGGWGFEAVPPEQMLQILVAFPRLRAKEGFVNCFCQLARTKPETTYDTVVRDFGERYVEGYAVPGSIVDALLGSPFAE